MANYSKAITDKQLRYIEALAGEAGLSGDAWDHFPGMSRSKAQKSATASDASAAIEALEECIEKKRKMETLADGELLGGTLRLGGKNLDLAEAALTAYRELAPQLVGRWAEVAALRLQLSEEGNMTPLMSAMKGVAGTATPRERALVTIRSLMAEHGISIDELR